MSAVTMEGAAEPSEHSAGKLGLCGVRLVSVPGVKASDLTFDLLCLIEQVSSVMQALSDTVDSPIVYAGQSLLMQAQFVAEALAGRVSELADGGAA